MTETPFRCEHCGQTIRKPQRWQPNPQQHATIAQAAQELGLSREAVHLLVATRWLTVAGHYYGPHAKSLTNGSITYVTRESIDEAKNRQPNILTTADKRRILQTLSDVGILGPLKWAPRRYPRHQPSKNYVPNLPPPPPPKAEQIIYALNLHHEDIGDA